MRMKCIVFYSWQSDRPNSTNRGFIQRALESAAKAIRDDETILVEPVVDRDTAGVPGSPDIGSTIFEKIEKAQVFICDLTLINTEAAFILIEDKVVRINEDKVPRPTPNPNVLLELGYALKTLGPSRILMVINTAYGKAEMLPFDLRTKRVIPYDLPETGDRAPERKKLEGMFEARLREILSGVVTDSVGEQIQPKPFADQAIEAIEAVRPNQAYYTRKFMEDLAERLQALKPNFSDMQEDQFDDLLIERIDQSLPIVIELARVAEMIAAMKSLEASHAMYKGFEYIAQGYNNPVDFAGSFLQVDFDFHKFMGHELFVSFLSFLVRERRWDIITEILSEDLDVRNSDQDRRSRPRHFDYLSVYPILLEHRNDRLKLSRLSLHADILNRRHTEGDLAKVVPMREFMEADYFLYLRGFQEEHTYSEFSTWRPLSGLYLRMVPSFIQEAVRTKNAEKLLGPMKLKNIEELKVLLSQQAPLLEKMYSRGFWDHPLAAFDIASIASRQ